MDCFSKTMIAACHCGAASCEEHSLARLREEQIEALKQLVRDLTAQNDFLRSGDDRATQEPGAPASADCAGSEAQTQTWVEFCDSILDGANETAEAPEQLHCSGAEASCQDWTTFCDERDLPAGEAGSDPEYVSGGSQSDEEADAVSAEASSDDATEAGHASDSTETSWESEWTAPTTAWSDDAEEIFVPIVSDAKKALWEPSAHCRADCARISDILDQALLSASRTVYKAYNELDPESCFEKWDCPENVGWGRSEMLGDLMERTSFNQVFGGNQEAGKVALDAVVRTRNAACHPSNHIRGQSEACTTENLDHLLSYAQELARMLGNHKEMALMRGLRDELQMEARKTWAELLELASHPVTPSKDNCSKALLRTFLDYDFSLYPQEKHIPLLVAALKDEAESRHRKDTAGPRSPFDDGRLGHYSDRYGECRRRVSDGDMTANRRGKEERREAARRVPHNVAANSRGLGEGRGCETSAA
ncbi:hypothetical protein CERZMDRAFT_81118 [Cercospora zeae-maydis SCOH1-5]|uniref:Uncharacterized protein n=1 Tax=Cercospora zeae-maydis SCOH1-5 TaxID=717836 RepID=A0A6A6FUQ7_9PEZI|nr:hypothetical protein CERZMDRAFT_81118 [Cercospora zeae-maydis SCOH1-5]